MCTLAGQRVAEDPPGRAGRPASSAIGLAASFGGAGTLASREPAGPGTRRPSHGHRGPGEEGKDACHGRADSASPTALATASVKALIEPDMCHYVSDFGGLGGASRDDVGVQMRPHVGHFRATAWPATAPDVSPGRPLAVAVPRATVCSALAAYQFRDALCRLLLQRRDGMRVGVQGDRDVGVAEPLADDLGVDVGLQGQRRVGVA